MVLPPKWDGESSPIPKIYIPVGLTAAYRDRDWMIPISRARDKFTRWGVPYCLPSNIHIHDSHKLYYHIITMKPPIPFCEINQIQSMLSTVPTNCQAWNSCYAISVHLRYIQQKRHSWRQSGQEIICHGQGSRQRKSISNIQKQMRHRKGTCDK